MYNLRMWIADKLIGKASYIKNVKFYQTVCLDLESKVHLNNVDVKLGHDIEWKCKKSSIGFYFEFYEQNLAEKTKSPQQINNLD
jgi:hypothetical protein